MMIMISVIDGTGNDTKESHCEMF